MKCIPKKAIISLLLCLSLLFSGLPIAAFAVEGNTEETEFELVNIANQCEINGPTAEAGHPFSNLTDGDGTTSYNVNGAVWPTEVIFTLPQLEYPVEKVVVKFLHESAYPNRSLDVDISYMENGGSSYVSAVSEQKHKLSSAVEYIPEGEGIDISNLKIAINNPMDGDSAAGFWPAIAEVEIYAKQQVSGIKMTNIASECVIDAPEAQDINPLSNLTDGSPSTLYVANGYLEEGQFPVDLIFTLPENRLSSGIKKVVVKFEEGFPNRSVDVTLSSANGDSNYQEIKKVENNTFDKDFEYVCEDEKGLDCTSLKINLANPITDGEPGQFWPGLAEVEIYAEEEIVDYTNVAEYAKVTSVGSVNNNDSGDISNLFDKSESTTYQFWSGEMSSLNGEAAWILFDLGTQYQVQSFDIAIMKESNSHEYIYSIWGLDEGSDDSGIAKTSLSESEAEELGWQKLVASQSISTTGVNKQNHSLASLTPLTKVAIHVEDIKSGGTPWPSLAEFSINVPTSTLIGDEDDGTNIAKDKKVHSNYNNEDASNIVDGNTATMWTGTQYPAYVDIDLQDNFNISQVQVFSSPRGYSKYGIYYSLNGRDFTLFNRKDNEEESLFKGESFYPETADADTATEELPNGTVDARYIRVYVEYNSESSSAQLREVRVYGTESNSETQELPEINVSNYDEWLEDQGVTLDENGEYVVTEEETIEEVQGIITRILGKQYVDWFELDVEENTNENKYDYFEISNGTDGKIKIKGNDGVSIATGLNHYLKYYCKVSVSEVEDQVSMPETAPEVEGTIRKETKFPIRYSYNYCTLSYTMAFWGEDEWRHELDWLALNGVNAVLDATGQEEVWRRFLTELGYSQQEIRDFIAGPAYYAWAYMDNLSGFGGPVHDSWYETRTELARQNQLSMRRLGMQPVLQGYCGMVPENILEHDEDLQIIVQGEWNAITRPPMIVTTSDGFKEYAEKFYAAQKEVFGDWSHFYATDPFHEGGKTGSLNPTDIGEIVMEEMLKADPDAIWVIQSWQGNPTSALLTGIKQADNNADGSHALILDLWAEHTPNYNKANASSYGPEQEFNAMPWIFCMLNNFGGRMGLHGHIESIVNIANVANTTTHMAGIGITPEGSNENPMLYDLLFETIWSETPDNLEEIDLDQWIADYAQRRYGAVSESAVEALKILSQTVYKSSYNMDGQGAPESVVNARPRMTSIQAASTWGNSVIRYDKVELQNAAELLLADYDILKDSPAYIYDLADVLKQVLSNTAQQYHIDMMTAASSGDHAAFDETSQKFLDLIDEVDKVLSTTKRFLLGTWEQSALDLAKDTDDFTYDLYRFNARALITTWGSYKQSENGRLHDYSNRQWAGLTSDFYKARWQKYIDAYKANDYSDPGITDDDWFEYEWNWVTAKDDKVYTNIPSGNDLEELGNEILESYALEPNPAADSSRDYPPTSMTATASSEQPGEEGPASNTLDDDYDTIWHSLWAGAENYTDIYITFDLGSPRPVDGLRYLPRQDSAINGRITGYRIEIDTGDGTFKEVASGTWADDANWKMATFEEQNAVKVRLVVTNSRTDSDKIFGSAAEIRITGSKSEGFVYKSALEAKIAQAQEALENARSDEKKEALREAIESANALLADESATQDIVDAMVDALDIVINMEDSADVDKTELEAKITEAQTALANAKSEDKKSALTEAIAQANALMTDETATQEEIDAMVDALNEAISMDDTLPYNLGDVNHDGKIDVSDATLVLQRYAGIIGDDYKNYDPTLADVNGDKKVDVSDATLILQRYGGIIKEFPAKNEGE